MSEFLDLKPGVPVHVLVKDGTLSATYESVIREVTDHAVYIDLPRSRHRPAEFNAGDEVTLYVQLHGRIYRLESRVRLVEHEGEARVALDQPTEAKRMERREFYRLMVTIPPRYAARIGPEGDELEPLEATILDISGGGVQLQSKQWMPVGARLRLIFSLDDDPVEVDAWALALSVVRPDPRHQTYRVHCAFIDMPRAQQERIVRFVFRKQIDLRQRGVA